MHWIDPASLPETLGTIDLWLVNADGEIDGFVLMGGTEVHVPPHMGGAVAEVARPGERVRVRGVHPRLPPGEPPMIAAVSVAGETGAPVIDAGPPDDRTARDHARKQARAARAPMRIEGVVRMLLHGPKGEPRGVLLEDGRAGRFPPDAAPAVLPLARPGAAIVLEGEGAATAHGLTLSVSAAGPASGRLAPLRGRDPKRDAT